MKKTIRSLFLLLSALVLAVSGTVTAFAAKPAVRVKFQTEMTAESGTYFPDASAFFTVSYDNDPEFQKTSDMPFYSAHFDVYDPDVNKMTEEDLEQPLEDGKYTIWWTNPDAVIEAFDMYDFAVNESYRVIFNYNEYYPVCELYVGVNPEEVEDHVFRINMLGEMTINSTDEFPTHLDIFTYENLAEDDLSPMNLTAIPLVIRDDEGNELSTDMMGQVASPGLYKIYWEDYDRFDETWESYGNYEEGVELTWEMGDIPTCTVLVLASAEMVKALAGTTPTGGLTIGTLYLSQTNLIIIGAALFLMIVLLIVLIKRKKH